MDKSSTIFVAGARGLVGSAIVRELKRNSFQNILTPSSSELNLLNAAEVESFFLKHKIDYVFLAAAKVGGIHSNNTYPVEFLTENLKIELNVIENSFRARVKKLLFLGSSCVYPKMATQPIVESELLNGPLEPTNKAYALAKISGIVLCQSYNKQYGTKYISVMPTNLFGPGDNYHPENSHVIPGLIRRFHQAKIENLETVTIWGTGTPKREFMYSDDLASACLFLMEKYEDSEIINIGTGDEVTILELANKIAHTVGFKGKINFDTSKPDGTPRKLLNLDKLSSYNWKPRFNLDSGLKLAYEDFVGQKLK